MRFPLQDDEKECNSEGRCLGVGCLFGVGETLSAGLAPERFFFLAFQSLQDFFLALAGGARKNLTATVASPNTVRTCLIGHTALLTNAGLAVADKYLVPCLT